MTSNDISSPIFVGVLGDIIIQLLEDFSEWQYLVKFFIIQMRGPWWSMSSLVFFISA